MAWLCCTLSECMDLHRYIRPIFVGILRSHTLSPLCKVQGMCGRATQGRRGQVSRWCGTGSPANMTNITYGLSSIPANAFRPSPDPSCRSPFYPPWTDGTQARRLRGADWPLDGVD